MKLKERVYSMAEEVSVHLILRERVLLQGEDEE